MLALASSVADVPQQPSQPPVPQVFETLEELILAMDGKGEDGALRQNMLEPANGPFSTEFRGRTSELKQFAKDVHAYKTMASSDRAEHHPFFVAAALPGTGKTTFALESFARLPEYLTADTAEIIRNGVIIYLNLNGGNSSWKIADNALNAEARLVARIVATVFLNRGYDGIWRRLRDLLRANVQLLELRKLISLIAAAQRAKLGKDRDAKLSALLVLDEFQHVGDDLNNMMRPILSTMGDSKRARCFDSDGVLVVPLLTGTSLEGAKAVEVLSGHPSNSINLEPFSDSDSFAILHELLHKQDFELPRALLDYFAPALDADQLIEALPARQLCFRGLVLDCGGNPSLLVHLARQLAEYCNGCFTVDSNDFLDGLFLSFSKPTSVWSNATAMLSAKARALPKSLVSIVVASLPIHVDRPAVDHLGKAMGQTWSQLLSSCGLSPKPHPFFTGRWMIQVPYVFLRVLVGESAFVPLRACTEFPYLYRSGQAFENLVFKIHAQRTFHLLGRSNLAIRGTTFQQLFPGGFVPAAIGECPVRLPNETAEREGGPQYRTEAGWCHFVKGEPGWVDNIPPSALSGDVYKAAGSSHYHFEGRSALCLQPSAEPDWTNVLLLWQTKLSQPGSQTAFGFAEIRKWHARARELTESWALDGIKVIFVLVLFRKMSKSDSAAGAKAVYEEVRQYAQTSEDLVIVTKEHMGEYLAGLAHRLYVPLESASTATA